MMRWQKNTRSRLNNGYSEWECEMSRDEKTSFKKEDILFIFKKMYEKRSLRKWDLGWIPSRKRWGYKRCWVFGFLPLSWKENTSYCQFRQIWHDSVKVEGGGGVKKVYRQDSCIMYLHNTFLYVYCCRRY